MRATVGGRRTRARHNDVFCWRPAGAKPRADRIRQVRYDHGGRIALARPGDARSEVALIRPAGRRSNPVRTDRLAISATAVLGI
jgi:hypothetical protein